MSRYAAWSEAVIRYGDLTRTFSGSSAYSDGEIHYMQYAENEVDNRLGSKYSVPFSSNNLTAKDLSIDLAYLKVMMVKNPEKAATLKEALDARFARLLSGDEVMLTSSGDTVGQVGDTIWSTTQDYHPVFGLGDNLDFAVDSDRIDAEEAARL